MGNLRKPSHKGSPGLRVLYTCEMWVGVGFSFLGKLELQNQTSLGLFFKPANPPTESPNIGSPLAEVCFFSWGSLNTNFGLSNLIV